jgi:hypothetical protein
MSTNTWGIIGSCAGTFLAGILAGAYLNTSLGKTESKPAPSDKAPEPIKLVPSTPVANPFEDKLPVTDSDEDSDDDGSDESREPYKMVRKYIFCM